MEPLGHAGGAIGGDAGCNRYRLSLLCVVFFCLEVYGWSKGRDSIHLLSMAGTTTTIYTDSATTAASSSSSSACNNTQHVHVV